jgi:glycosyltransferase involved in cell wall biosynthesis
MLHPRQADLAWRELDGATEAEVAQTFGASSVHLALPRMEAVGLPSLEAMAAGCVCTGFLGVGGAEYATPDNGVWAPEDDCEAAADALARADDLARTGGPALARMLEAARETAVAWSYARFREALETFWTRHAPDVRVKTGALD